MSPGLFVSVVLGEAGRVEEICRRCHTSARSVGHPDPNMAAYAGAEGHSGRQAGADRGG
jgi:hypothetical protein